MSDSHCFAHSLLDGVDRVISFDAHHDCWDIDNNSKNEVFCDNWLRHWIKAKKKNKAVWVRPDWLDKDALTLPSDLKSRVEVMNYSKVGNLGLEGSVIVHVCRSGCWVPPWLDKAFLGFLKASGRPVEHMSVLQDGEWNPMVERWSEDKLKQVIAEEENIKRMRDEMMRVRSPALYRSEVVKIGTMKSSDFVNGKVEVRDLK